jgi:hypothetical protein
VQQRNAVAVLGQPANPSANQVAVEGRVY